MQVLVDGEVWLGNPGMDVLTYDSAQVAMLPTGVDLVDPVLHPSCVGAWQDDSGWCWAAMDVETTLVRAHIVSHGKVFRMPVPPVWWLSDEVLRRKLSMRL